MTRFQQRFNKRVRELCKAEKGKSQINRGDMQTALVIFAKAFDKNPVREINFLNLLAKKHMKKSSKVAKNRKRKGK